MREEKQNFKERVNNVYEKCGLNDKSKKETQEIKDFNLPNEIFDNFSPKSNSNYTVIEKKFW